MLPMSGSATPKFGIIKRSRRDRPKPRSLRPVRRARVSTRSDAVMAHAIEATPFLGPSRAGRSPGAGTGTRIRADPRALAASRHRGTVVDACHLVGFGASSRSWPRSSSQVMEEAGCPRRSEAENGRPEKGVAPTKGIVTTVQARACADLPLGSLAVTRRTEASLCQELVSGRV